MQFSEFLNEGRHWERDVEKTLRKIPKSHARLVRGYKFRFQPYNTLKGDDGHIGFIDEEKKTITIASPWNYGREYTLLHEVGHAVWKYAVDDGKKAEWKKILGPTRKANKKDLNQNDEEIFCMSYAQAYANNGITKFDHEELVEFARRIK
jgi:hypothetical protein